MYRRLAMKSKRFISLSILAGLSIGLFAGAITSKKAAEGVYTPTFATYTTGDGATYYNDISDSISGTDLLSALRTLNGRKKQASGGYKALLTGAFHARYTDYDIAHVQYDSNGRPYSDYIVSFYSGNVAYNASGMNREHVWPDSRGGNLVEADTHMARPTLSAENSARGNSFYVEGMKSSTSGWDPAMESFGDETYRGDSARIIFYCAMANSSLTLIDNTNDSANNKTMGKLADLIKWNINYPVQQREQNRNEGVEYIQGNRNPFIDHPEYACRIWGNASPEIASMCSNASWEVPAGVSISKTTLSIVEGNTATIYATSTDGSAINWSSSDTDVATISSAVSASGTNITINALAAGTANVTATATIDGDTYTATCRVTVSSSSGGEIPVSGSYDILTSDLDNGSYPGTPTDYTAASGIKFKAYNCANFSSKIQFKKSGGYIYNTQALNLATLTINNMEGSLTVYAGNSVNPSNQINGNNGVYNLSGNNYFKIINSSDNVARSTKITIDVSDGEELEKTLESISIATAPIRTTYTVGDCFDPTGLVINRFYSDDTSDTYSYDGHADEFTFTPSLTTALTEDDIEVAITYKDLECIQSIEVEGIVAQKTLSSITLSGQKTTFDVGEEFVFGGTVTAYYSDGDYENVTWAATFSGYNMSVAGTQEVTVSYTEDGVTVTATYNITVVNPVISVTSVTLNYEATILYVGDTLQLEATVNPTDATNKNVTWECATTEGENVVTVVDGLITANSKGKATVTVRTVDGDFTATCVVHVYEKETPKPQNVDVFGCGGSIVATSVILSTLALTGLSIVLIKKNKEK